MTDEKSSGSGTHAAVTICTRFAFCETMKKALNRIEGKGLNELMGWYVSPSNGEKRPRRFGVAYRPSVRGDNEFLLNVCPWCRAEINFFGESPSPP